MKVIQLSKGYVAFVDDMDFDRVNALPWYANELKEKGKVVQVYGKHDARGSLGRISLHQFVVEVRTTPFIVVNHIDGNGLNNTRKNLEVVPQSVNARKSKLRNVPTGRTSKYRGVSYRRSKHCVLTKCWATEVTYRYEKVFRGYYESEREAALAYNEAVLRIFGPDAGFPLNDPLND